MHLLLSGEGPSDIGVCYPAAEACSVEAFKPGPMAWLVDQWVERVVSNGYPRHQGNFLGITHPSAARRRYRSPKVQITRFRSTCMC